MTYFACQGDWNDVCDVCGVHAERKVRRERRKIIMKRGMKKRKRKKKKKREKRKRDRRIEREVSMPYRDHQTYQDRLQSVLYEVKRKKRMLMMM